MSYIKPRDILENLFFYVGIHADGPNRSRPGAVVNGCNKETRARLRELTSDDLRDVAPWFLKQVI